MKKLSKILALVLALAMAVSVLAACGNKNNTASNGSDNTDSDSSASADVGSGSTEDDGSFTRQTEEGTLTVGTYLDSAGFDVANSGNTCGLWLIYEQLLTMDYATGEYKPMLAESYEYVDDTHIQFKLRDDAKFSDGSDVTSNDVYVSWKHFLDSGSQWIYYLNWVDIDNFEIIDDKNFIVAMNDSYSFAEAYLCNRYASVMSADWIENASDEDWWTGAIASGPYTCVENVSGSHAVFERNDDYWNADLMPEAKTVTVRYYTSTSTMMVDYESGALDAALDIDGTDAERVLNGEVPATNYDIMSRSDVYTLALPEYVSDFDTLEVRQAISYAIDADAVGEAGLGVLGDPVTSILPSDCNDWIDCTGIGATGYDPDKAIELLESVNYVQSEPDGYTFVVPNYTYNINMSEAIQAYLEQVGIKINLVQADLVTCITEYFMTGKAQMVINSCGAANHEPDQQLNTTYSTSTNGTVAISDEAYNALVVTARTDPENSKQAYEDMQTWHAENCRQIGLVEPKVCNVYHSYISALNSPVYDYNYLRYVTFA